MNKTKKLTTALRLGFLALFFIIPHRSYARTSCVAHRGDRENFIDNSLKAFDSALKLLKKYSHTSPHNGIEFDIRHTQDGIPIITHDYTLERTARNKRGKVCPLQEFVQLMTWPEIRDNCELKDGSPIPLLQDVLEKLKDSHVMVFIELKDTLSEYSYGIIKHYYTKYLQPKNLRILSFIPHTLWHFRWHAYGSEEHSFWSEIKIVFESVLAKPHTSFDGVSVHWAPWPSRKSLEMFGKEIGVWEIDDPDELRSWIEAEVDFVTTNKLSQCLRILEEYN